MGKSFVLKDASGRPGGYLVQGMRETCCRADTPAQQAVLLFEDGTEETHALCGGQEAHWPCGGRLLRGGFVCADGRLLLATGEEARGAFARRSTGARAAQGENRPDAQRPPETPEPARTLAPEANRPAKPMETPRAWPQRRWPPPPCWPGAQYAKGRWREREAQQ